jgi:hypothetical protein
MRRRVETGSDAELQESDTSLGAREFKLGILLVRGIGTPRAGDRLVHRGDALFKTIARARWRVLL